MDFASRIVKELFNKNLSGGYAITFLIFVVIVISFVVWSIFYLTVKKAAGELTRISWLSMSDTVKYTAITLVAIIIISSILFVYDFGLDKLVNVILENAKQ